MTLVEGLQEREIEPVVFAPGGGPLADLLAERDIEIIIASYHPWMAPPRRWLLAPVRLWHNRRVLPSVRRRLRALQPDLIHSNSSVLGIAAMVATDLSIPHVWHLREFARDAFRMRPDLGWRHMRRWLERSTAYIAVSHVVKETLLSSQAQSRCAVIYNGVLRQSEMLRLRNMRERSTRDGDSTFKFLMVGRISPLKGQAEAIEALAQLQEEAQAPPELKLTIVGGGNHSYVETLQRKARQLGVNDRVEFVGFNENPFPFYVAADAVLVCSRSEGMGRVTAEAMGVGVPVIGRNTTGTAELIEDERTGLLYNGQIQALAGAMRRLIDDPVLGSKLAERAWAQAYESYSIETYCSRTYALFNQVIRGE